MTVDPSDSPSIECQGQTAPRTLWRDRLGRACLFVLLAGLLAGCTQFVDTIPVAAEPSLYEVHGSRMLGQSFLCHHAGLVGISVRFRSQTGDHEVILHLKDAREDVADIATARIVPTAGRETYHFFRLPVQDDVNGKWFSMFLESPTTTSDEPILVPYSEISGSDHTLYLDDAAVEGRVSFKLHYSTLHIAKDVGTRLLPPLGVALWRLFLSSLLYLLPGGAIVVWMVRPGDGLEKLIVAGALSVALNAMLFYPTMIGLRLSPAIVWAYLAGCTAVIGMRLVRSTRGSSLGSWLGSIRAGLAVKGWFRQPQHLALAVVVVLVWGVRIWVTRGMSAPRWGDSYQHAVVAQLMVDRGGIFNSWEPYAPYRGLTTHFAFQANAALFQWISGVSAPDAVLWVGQVFNAMAVLALYPLGRRMGGSWAGTVAVMVGGLLSATPMVYINWGRYPQLTGQILLPIAVWLLWQGLDQPKFEWQLLVAAAVPTAGQALGYYRMPYYYAALVVGLLVCVYLPALGRRWREWGHLFLRLGVVGAVSALLLVPWGAHIAQSSLVDFVASGAAYGSSAEALRAEYAQWLSLPLYVSTPLLAVAGLAWLWGVRRKAGPVLALTVWAVGLFLLVATRAIGLPGATHLNAFASIIFTYAPVSLLIGWLGGRVALFLSGRWGLLGRGVSAVGVASLALLGAYVSVTRSDPAYDLVEPGDLEAMAWIRANTPTDARFLVNGFLIYDGHSVVGSDAGWWIPLLARRENTMPPQYALVNEREIEPGYGQRMVDLVAQLRETPLSTPRGIESICNEEITHVYMGQGQGRVGTPAPEPLFAVDELTSSPAFEPVYHRDRVWIFELSQAACGR